MDQTDRFWFVLNYIAPIRSRREDVKSVVDKFATANSVRMEAFAPKFVEMEHRGGEVKFVERPLLYHYVFVYGAHEDVKRLCGIVSGFSFVINPNSDERYLRISESQMQSFRTIAQFYGNRLPCFSVNEVELERGDLVEVVSGKFAGLKGTYISRRGASSGNIIVSLTHDLAAAIYDIDVEYVRVLQFAKDSKRAYDQIDAYVPRLFAALRLYSSGKDIPREILAPLIVFSRRFEIVKLNNVKLDAKLQALLVVTARILGDSKLIEMSMTRYRRLSKSITNPATLALVNLIFGVSENDMNMIDDGYLLMSGHNIGNTKYTNQLREEYSYYKKHYMHSHTSGGRKDI